MDDYWRYKMLSMVSHIMLQPRVVACSARVCDCGTNLRETAIIDIRMRYTEFIDIYHALVLTSTTLAMFLMPPPHVSHLTD